MKKYCLVIDPFSSSSLLSVGLIANHITPIVIATQRLNLSDEEMRQHYKDYPYIFKYSEEAYPKLLQELSAFSIVRVIAGNESSVDIADKLAAHFTPTLANPIASSSTRMDKFDMQEATRTAGLNAVKQIKVFDAILTEEQKQLLTSWKFPLIVKPNNSRGSINVSTCNDFSEIETALTNIIGKPDKLNTTTVDCAVIQACLQGTEYFVDTVSLQGKTFVTSVQHYHKVLFNHHRIYRYIEINDPNTAAAKKCMNYVKDVLVAAELNNGFGHTELFLTPEPCLIEINARISGTSGMTNRLAYLCTGEDQVSLMAKSINDPQKFLTMCQQPPLPLKQYGRVLLLQNWHPKKIKELAVEKLKNCPSYREHLQLKPAGSHLELPAHMFDTVAYVLLAHPSYEQVVADSKFIFELEQEGKLF